MGGFLLSQEWYGVLPDFCFRRNGIEYYRISCFRRIRRCTRHHAGLDPASIGFLLSQEWYGGIPAFAGVETEITRKINIFCYYIQMYAFALWVSRIKVRNYGRVGRCDISRFFWI